jgi:hypothetical protein
VSDRAATTAVDFNSLLMCANVLVAAAIVLAPSTLNNPYLDRETIVLGLLLCLQTHAALILERRRRDPMMVLLAAEMIFYYALRIFTLTLYPFSFVFGRYPYAPADTNHALTFILIANILMYAGLYLAGTPQRAAVDASGWRAVLPSRVAFLIALAIGVSYFSESHSPGEVPPRILGFLELFVSANVIILMGLAYYFLFRRSLSHTFTVVLGVLIVFDMFVHTLAGSRSAIVTFIQDLVLIGLAMFGCVRLPRRYVVMGVLSIPLVAALLILTFVVSTYNRSNRQLGASFDFGGAVAMGANAGGDQTLKDSLDLTLPLIFARTGFLDYSAEVMAHRAQYRSVINLPVYGESVVDNILTPGFDVYDMPKVANALQYVYMEWGTPSKMNVPENYQSDQLGIYGEYYALFGVAGLPLIFIAAYMFKRLYVRMTSVTPYFLVVKRVVILYLFLEVVRSFGIDWVLAEAVPIVAAIYLYSYFFRSKPIAPTAAARRIAAVAAGT